MRWALYNAELLRHKQGLKFAIQDTKMEDIKLAEETLVANHEWECWDPEIWEL